jgi:hypothetical protein
MTQFINKNDRQVYFNQIKGAIEELNPGEAFCSITLRVGHENTRLVNFTIKKPYFNELSKAKKIGDKVTVRFYLSSKYKNNRWYTMANVLDVLTEEYID